MLTIKLLSTSQQVGRTRAKLIDISSKKTSGWSIVKTSWTVVEVVSATVKNSFRLSVTETVSRFSYSVPVVVMVTCFIEQISLAKPIKAFDHSFLWVSESSLNEHARMISRMDLPCFNAFTIVKIAWCPPNSWLLRERVHFSSIWNKTLT